MRGETPHWYPSAGVPLYRWGGGRGEELLQNIIWKPLWLTVLAHIKPKYNIKIALKTSDQPNITWEGGKRGNCMFCWLKGEPGEPYERITYMVERV
jgi:hypothetical protein